MAQRGQKRAADDDGEAAFLAIADKVSEILEKYFTWDDVGWKFNDPQKYPAVWVDSMQY